MITNFKIYESEQNGESFYLNDIIDYFDGDRELIKKFIEELFEYKRYVIFNCVVCVEMIRSVRIRKHHRKTHKGYIRGSGFGFGTIADKIITIHLELELIRIKHEHTVKLEDPITVFNVPQNLKKIINDINTIRTTKKYNL